MSFLDPITVSRVYVVHRSHSVLEMQAMVADLIENFDFALPDNAKEMVILRKPSVLMMPMVKDHMELGGYLGLKVTSVR